MSAIETGAHHSEKFECNGVGWGDPAEVDTTFENQRFSQYQDSAQIEHAIPLYEQVKQQIQYWRDIGTNQVVLNWIEHGVEILPNSTIPNFFQKQCRSLDNQDIASRPIHRHQKMKKQTAKEWKVRKLRIILSKKVRFWKDMIMVQKKLQKTRISQQL